MWPPGGSKGSGRSYAPHSAASAAWKRTVVSAARLSLLPSLTNSRFPRLGAAEADAFLVDVVAEAAATRALRDTVYAPICASNATANDAVLASAFYAKVLAQPEGTRGGLQIGFLEILKKGPIFLKITVFPRI